MNRKLVSYFCDPKTALRNVGLLLLMVFLTIYAVFQILPTFTHTIKTETALMVSLYDTCETTGYVFRSEQLVEKPGEGETVTLVKDGERVSRGQLFANVYTDASSAGLQEQINAIDRKIEILSKSVVDTDLYVTDITKTDVEIESSLNALFEKVANRDLTDAVSIENSLLVSLNKKKLITNMTSSYQNEIASLQSERGALQSRIRSVSRALYASSAGYFYGDVDGYEHIFTPDVLDSLTLDSFHSLIAASAEPTTGVAGKLVTDFVWYLVCEADKYAVAGYEKGHSYRLRFPSFSDDVLVNMKLTQILSETASDTALLVFRGNTAPEGFPYLRQQTAEIIGQSYTGLAVPKKAVRIVEGKQGVYILDGDIVRFRRVEVLFEDEEYYIVSPEAPIPDEPQTEDVPVERYLALYDSIIVSGKDLFDGKIVA